MPPTRGRGRGTRGRQPARGRKPAATKVPAEAESETAVAEEVPTDKKSAVETTKKSEKIEEMVKDVEDDVDITNEGDEMELEGSGEEVDEEMTEEANACQTSAADTAAETEPAGIETGLDEEASHKTTTDVDKKEASVKEQTAAAEDNNPEDAIVVSDDNESADEEMETDENTSPSGPVWQVRVYPVPFRKFCNMDSHFRKMMKTSLNFEFRMSSVLMDKQFVPTNEKKNPVPWFASDVTPSEAPSLGLVEMKVSDAGLVDLIQSARSARLCKTAALRVELKQLSKTEPRAKPWKKNMDIVDPTTMENEDTPPKGLTVNFVEQYASIDVQEAAVQQHISEGTQEAKEDHCVFVDNIPNDLPDNVLQAIFLTTKMVERKKGKNGSGSAIFDAGSPVGAQICIEQFNGILVNNEPFEVTTKQETFQDDKTKMEAFELPEEKRQEILAAQKETMEACKVEILNVLPKTAAPNLPASKTATEETAPETESMEKTKSEETNTTEEARLEKAAEKEISFPQSQKVKEVTEIVDKYLSEAPCPTFNTPFYFPPKIFPDLVNFDPDLYSPYSEAVFTECSKQEEPGNFIPPRERSVLMLMTAVLRLEALMREQVAVSSFQELATCALNQILSKSEMASEDVTAMRSIVDGLHQSSLVLGASALVSAANLRLDKRDSYLHKLPVSEKVKLRLRKMPIEDQVVFENLKKEIMDIEGADQNLSGQGEEKQSANKRQGTPSNFRTSDEQSKEDAVTTKPTPEATSTKDMGTSSTQASVSTPPPSPTTTSTKGEELKGKQEAEAAEIKACMAAINQALLTSVTETDSLDSASIKSHEILKLLNSIDSLLSSPSFKASSFIDDSVLPLPLQFHPDHYKTVDSYFQAAPPTEEKEIVALGIQSPDHCIRLKWFARFLQERAGTQVALACFAERASRALQLILDVEKSIDVEALRLIVRGINRSATVCLNQAIVSATTFQVMRRIAIIKRLAVDDGQELKAAPVGGDGGLFGPVLASIIEEGVKNNKPLALRKERRGHGKSFTSSPGQARYSFKQAASSSASKREGTRGAPVGRGPKRLQGANAGASRRGKRPQAATGGRHPAAAAAPARGGSRGSHQGSWSHRNARRGSKGFSPGQQRQGSGSNIKAMHAGIQAQVQVAQRELVFLQQQAKRAQLQMLEEQERLSKYQQNVLGQGRSYSQDAGRNRSRWSGRGNKSRGRLARRQR